MIFRMQLTWRTSFVWCKNLDRSFYCFVTIHACDRQTDRQTARILIAIPRLHYTQRGKKISIPLRVT